MHPTVHAREVGQEIERAEVALGDRVVETHFDIRVRVEGGDGGIESAGTKVVEQ